MLGWTVSIGGDSNNDGYCDLIADMPFYDGDIGNEGRVTRILGGPQGLVEAETQMAIHLDTLGKVPEARLGFAISGSGDVNGDGFDELAVGTPLAMDGEGDCFVYEELWRPPWDD